MATEAPPDVKTCRTSPVLPRKSRVWCVCVKPARSVCSTKRISVELVQAKMTAGTETAASVTTASATVMRPFLRVLMVSAPSDMSGQLFARPKLLQIGIHALVRVKLVIDVGLEIVAVACQPRFELSIVREFAQPLGPDGPGLVHVVSLPITVTQRNVDPHVIGSLGPRLLHAVCLPKISHAQRSAQEHLRPE